MTQSPALRHCACFVPDPVQVWLREATFDQVETDSIGDQVIVALVGRQGTGKGRIARSWPCSEHVRLMVIDEDPTAFIAGLNLVALEPTVASGSGYVSDHRQRCVVLEQPVQVDQGLTAGHQPIGPLMGLSLPANAVEGVMGDGPVQKVFARTLADQEVVAIQHGGMSAGGHEKDEVGGITPIKIDTHDLLILVVGKQGSGKTRWMSQVPAHESAVVIVWQEDPTELLAYVKGVLV